MSIWTKERSDVFWSRIVLNHFNETDWIQNFRMRRETFLYLCDCLRARLGKEMCRSRMTVSVEKRKAISLWCLASTAEFRIFGVSKAFVSVTLAEFCEAVCGVLLPKYIFIPKGDDLNMVVQGFEEKYRFLQTVGAVEGTHIPIQAPPEHHVDYFNRTGWYSIILQALVDDNYCFRDINVGWPGSVHDARVFTNSELYLKGNSKTLFETPPKHSGTSITGILRPGWW